MLLLLLKSTFTIIKVSILLTAHSSSMIHDVSTYRNFIIVGFSPVTRATIPLKGLGNMSLKNIQVCMA